MVIYTLPKRLKEAACIKAIPKGLGIAARIDHL
ncbi:Uncharacterised protein [Legionella cincinnatiensis]|uniref:Uncharacterized protein n=1 Tax=Legionella cincinnatiensis TaxID=28085 RepID=A0A378IJI7_9GAMM|nr:Uncharacterised protein [Legionella cincinnatiensis]